MGDMKDAAFTQRVLELVAQADLHRDLFWRCDSNYAPVTFFVNCNDIFWWGCADAEKISPETVGLLEDAVADTLRVTGSSAYAGELFCARVRKMRPQGCFYEGMPESIAALFDACGPERAANEPGNTPRPARKARV